MLGATGVQIPKNNLDELHSSREEDGTSETMDPQDLLGSFLLADKDLIFLGLCVSLSRAVGFLRGTSAVVVILVKGHSFSTIVNVRPVELLVYMVVHVNDASESLKPSWGKTCTLIRSTSSTTEEGLQAISATIDGHEQLITEASLRRHLKLEDAKGISLLSNEEIFEQLAHMG
ncbi:hypothetical protein Tco_0734766, partial [Tanacetum coccineum]